MKKLKGVMVASVVAIVLLNVTTAFSFSISPSAAPLMRQQGTGNIQNLLVSPISPSRITVIQNAQAELNCDDTTKAEIILDPKKSTGGATTTYQFNVSIPAGTSIAQDASGAPMIAAAVGSSKLSISCSQKSDTSTTAASTDTSSVGVWTTGKAAASASDVVYTCLISDSLKGTESVVVTITGFHYSAKASCNAAFDGTGALDMSQSVELGTGVDASGHVGGDCSLNPTVDINGAGWLIDMLIFGLPTALISVRRKRK